MIIDDEVFTLISFGRLNMYLLCIKDVHVSRKASEYDASTGTARLLLAVVVDVLIILESL